MNDREPRSAADACYNKLINSGVDPTTASREAGRLLYLMGATKLSCRNDDEREGWQIALCLNAWAYD
jgi:hypothetical protein